MNKILCPLWLIILLICLQIAVTSAAQNSTPPTNKIPVIFDSDIGDDIDDTWALGFLLRSPELDVKLVIGDEGKILYRANLFAKFLQRADRTDIPIGLGVPFEQKDASRRQFEWIKDYDLKSYPGKIYEDGVQAIIDTIMKSPQPVIVIAVGPLPNIAEALKREPRITENARFVGMHGSVRLGYGGSKKIAAEYNVLRDVKSCQKSLSAPWDVTITPLDTCGLVRLTGEKYKKVFDSQDPIASAIIENYRAWSKKQKIDYYDNRSSILFDTVAVYLAFSQDLVKMETLPIRVTDDGFTKIDPSGKMLHVATEWKDMPAFEDLLIQRLINSVSK